MQSTTVTTTTSSTATMRTGGGSSTATVKMVVPFGLQCEKCRRRTNKGERVWAVKEEIGKDATFDVEVYRFVVTCLCCRANCSIRTDPGGYDYVLENGAILAPKKFKSSFL